MAQRMKLENSFCNLVSIRFIFYFIDCCPIISLCGCLVVRKGIPAFLTCFLSPCAMMDS